MLSGYRIQTPALKAEGTLGGPKITEVTGNAVGVLLVNVVRDSHVLFKVELSFVTRICHRWEKKQIEHSEFCVNEVSSTK